MQIGVESSRAVENKRVFVIDSDEITRAALQFMLHDENETHELPSLAAAYDKAARWKPDVILLGLPIIEAHGIESLRELRARLPEAKIAVVADFAANPTAQCCLSHGAQSILAKPYTIESVRRKVDLLLGRRASLPIPIHLT